MNDSERFLMALFEPYIAKEGLFCEIRSLGMAAGKGYSRRWFPLPWTPETLHEAGVYVQREDRLGMDVYVGVLPRTSQAGDRKSVAWSGWLWADFDALKIPDDTIVAAVQDADMLVFSGHGVHAYWRTNRLEYFTSDAARERFSAILERYQSERSGGRADNVSDVSRILRVPGTRNHKNAAEVVPVELVRCPPVAPPFSQDELDDLKRVAHEGQVQGALINRARRGLLPVMEEDRVLGGRLCAADLNVAVLEIADWLWWSVERNNHELGRPLAMALQAIADLPEVARCL